MSVEKWMQKYDLIGVAGERDNLQMMVAKDVSDQRVILVQANQPGDFALLDFMYDIGAIEIVDKLDEVGNSFRVFALKETTPIASQLLSLR